MHIFIFFWDTALVHFFKTIYRIAGFTTKPPSHLSSLHHLLCNVCRGLWREKLVWLMRQRAKLYIYIYTYIYIYSQGPRRNFQYGLWMMQSKVSKRVCVCVCVSPALPIAAEEERKARPRQLASLAFRQLFLCRKSLLDPLVPKVHK